jgi:hypothetical protein
MSDVFNLLQTKMRLSYNRVVVLVLAAALLSAAAPALWVFPAPRARRADGVLDGASSSPTAALLLLRAPPRRLLQPSTINVPEGGKRLGVARLAEITQLERAALDLTLQQQLGDANTALSGSFVGRIGPDFPGHDFAANGLFGGGADDSVDFRCVRRSVRVFLCVDGAGEAHCLLPRRCLQRLTSEKTNTNKQRRVERAWCVCSGRQRGARRRAVRRRLGHNARVGLDGRARTAPHQPGAHGDSHRRGVAVVANA